MVGTEQYPEGGSTGFLIPGCSFSTIHFCTNVLPSPLPLGCFFFVLFAVCCCCCFLLQPNVPLAKLYACAHLNSVRREGKSAGSLFRGCALRSIIVSGLRNALSLSKQFQTSPRGKAFSVWERETQERLPLSVMGPIRQWQSRLGKRNSRSSPVPQGKVSGLP